MKKKTNYKTESMIYVIFQPSSLKIMDIVAVSANHVNFYSSFTCM